jgi:hypothetical protein
MDRGSTTGSTATGRAGKGSAIPPAVVADCGVALGNDAATGGTRLWRATCASPASRASVTPIALSSVARFWRINASPSLTPFSSVRLIPI